MDKNIDPEYIRHGGAYDRGDADAYYGGARRPHYFVGATYQSEEIKVEDMTEIEIAMYHKGYEENPSGKKDWGYDED